MQLSSSTSSSQQQLYQELLKDRDTVKADRDKLLGDILQLQKETSRLVTLEQQQSAAVSMPSDPVTLWLVDRGVLFPHAINTHLSASAFLSMQGACCLTLFTL